MKKKERREQEGRKMRRVGWLEVLSGSFVGRVPGLQVRIVDKSRKD